MGSLAQRGPHWWWAPVSRLRIWEQDGIGAYGPWMAMRKWESKAISLFGLAGAMSLKKVLIPKHDSD